MAFNMVAHVKPTTHVLNDYSTKGFELGFIYGVGFLGPLGPYEIELNILDDYVSGVANDKTMVRVLTTTPIIRASA
jgi:hypothetical protein